MADTDPKSTYIFLSSQELTGNFSLCLLAHIFRDREFISPSSSFQGKPNLQALAGLQTGGLCYASCQVGGPTAWHRSLTEATPVVFNRGLTDMEPRRTGQTAHLQDPHQMFEGGPAPYLILSMAQPMALCVA